MRAQPREPHKRLDRLSEAHVVREDATEPGAGKTDEESETIELIGAQVSGDAERARQISQGPQCCVLIKPVRPRALIAAVEGLVNDGVLRRC